MRKLILRLIEFGKKNSAALIIGASLIVGLNFERFINYAAEIPDAISLAIYNLSGQADADRIASQRYYDEQAANREREAREQQARLAQKREEQRQAEEAKRAKLEQAIQANNERGRIETATWQEFLAAN